MAQRLQTLPSIILSGVLLALSLCGALSTPLSYGTQARAAATSVSEHVTSLPLVPQVEDVPTTLSKQATPSTLVTQHGAVPTTLSKQATSLPLAAETGDVLTTLSKQATSIPLVPQHGAVPTTLSKQALSIPLAAEAGDVLTTLSKQATSLPLAAEAVDVLTTVSKQTTSISLVPQGGDIPMTLSKQAGSDAMRQDHAPGNTGHMQAVSRHPGHTPVTPATGLHGGSWPSGVNQGGQGLWSTTRLPGRIRIDKRRHAHKHRCCQGLCWCTDEEVDCSRQYGHLTFVPSIPRGIRFLNFSFNNLALIPEDFFLNATGIKVLDLSGNCLKNISDGAFLVFDNLTVLLLDHNVDLTYESLHPVFLVSSLKRLDLLHTNLGDPDNIIFTKYNLTHLQQLDITFNNLQVINLEAFSYLRNLAFIGLSDNHASRVISGFMRTLIKLNLNSNKLDTFLETCTNESVSFFPQLESLQLKFNLLQKLPSTICLPKLRILNLGGNLFTHLVTGMFSSSNFQHLTILGLSSMHTNIAQIDAFAFNNSGLKSLSLMFNSLWLGQRSYHPDCFAGLPNLSLLQLSHNHFGNLNSKQFQQYFGGLRNLEKLFLGFCEISNITAEMFTSFRHLRQLYLFQNRLTAIPVGAFDSMQHLTKLSLNSNQISHVEPTAFGVDTQKRLRHLELSGNPFVCSCDLLWFKSWMISRPSLFRPHWKSGSYQCQNMPHVHVTKFFIREQACLLSQGAAVMIIVVLGVFLCTGTVVSAVYRYRWHIRLVLYEAFRGDRDARWRRLRADNFRYDVYVSYAEDDLPWLRQNLLPVLENQLRLRLCLHQRDFMLGENIVDNISSSVQASKKIMVLFSRHYARDQWRQFELAFCMRHVMDYGDGLLVLCLHDLTARATTAAMMAILKTTSFIQWAEHPDAKASFYGRLRVALNEIRYRDDHL